MSCVSSRKTTRSLFPSSYCRYFKFALTHYDIWGLNHIHLILADDSMRCSWIYLLKSRSDLSS